MHVVNELRECVGGRVRGWTCVSANGGWLVA